MRRLRAVLPSLAAALAGALAGALGAGCRRPAPVTRVAPAPAALVEDHCWWAVFRTTLPPDTVAAHFARAFTALGLTDARTARLADTAWAQAGPTVLGGPRGGTYAVRVVAFRRGDTTLFRHFVAVGLPAHGRPGPVDSMSLGSGQIGFCGALGRAAAVHGAAPRGPNGEETLPVWTRRR